MTIRTRRNPTAKRRNRRVAALLLAGAGTVASALVAGYTPAWASVTFTTFQVPIDVGPEDITAGPDGNLWFTSETSIIGRIATDGTVTLFEDGIPGSTAQAITAGPDGNLWFVDQGTSSIGRMGVTGSVTEFPVPNGVTGWAITTGPDGNLWFAAVNSGQIGRITTDGVVTEFPVPSPFAIEGIAAGADGNLWFTEFDGSRIGRITTAGVVTEYPLPDILSEPTSIAAGPDGNLWFTEIHSIGRITTGGVITEFTLPATNYPRRIAAGPDGNLWFSDFNAFGRITPAGTLTLFPAQLAGPCGNTCDVVGLAAGPDGNMWFTDFLAHQIIRVNLSSAATLSAPGLNFANQPVATASAAQTISVTNTGDTVLKITAAGLIGANPADFTVAADGCSGVSVAIGSSCSVSVSFTPSALGARSASLQFADNAPDTPQTVTLGGTGIENADLRLSLTAAPSPISLGHVLTYTIAVSNLGPTGALGASVTDSLSPFTNFIGLSTSQGSCTNPGVGSTGTVSCSLGSVPNGATATIQIQVRVTGGTRGITNFASVSSTSFDGNSGNNSAVLITPIARH